ncbi:VIT1/CCC1 transporter family protein [Oceanomicrobium pacificus]|uniref:GMP synthase n=1 Tax=Oceanomicrobium pacificus TaxID=2692916 RepID=A0A6B0TVH2_9RHOB|nr:VIT1/CCC1 transporter family protein [Oceanomicrobium pacificus]MXU65775.1 GMP synthase [Oceanomicrobium pacificus]
MTSGDFTTRYASHKAHEHQVGPIQEFLKQIVYGGNDGIVTTFAIVAGFAGAGAEGAAQIGGIAVLLFGLANLFADATAMGLGEFLSSRSEHDVYRATRARELHEIHTNPDFESAEMVEILSDRGVAEEDARAMTDIMLRNPEFMADMMMTYEVEMADPSGDSPALKGLATFLAFILFGAIPISPYFILEPVQSTFYLSVAATALALAMLGSIRWRVTSETWLRCVGETMLVGGICALVAYLVGVLVA